MLYSIHSVSFFNLSKISSVIKIFYRGLQIYDIFSFIKWCAFGNNYYFLQTVIPAFSLFQMKMAKVKTDKSDDKAICEYALIKEVSLYTALTEVQSECL
jgi:hypothetical protein